CTVQHKIRIAGTGTQLIEAAAHGFGKCLPLIARHHRRQWDGESTEAGCMTRFQAGYEILVSRSIERSQGTDPVARRTAEDLINRRLGELAHEIEHGDVDASLRARCAAAR